ncbi:hypothetical protein AYK26_05630 [Euryarchaeota archaeon SM23-78]|nr:MAG: hypothetical protein AYK26_05630 [Euryarchaeota archaeon SM23-78]
MELSDIVAKHGIHKDIFKDTIDYFIGSDNFSVIEFAPSKTKPDLCYAMLWQPGVYENRSLNNESKWLLMRFSKVGGKIKPQTFHDLIYAVKNQGWKSEQELDNLRQDIRDSLYFHVDEGLEVVDISDVNIELRPKDFRAFIIKNTEVADDLEETLYEYNAIEVLEKGNYFEYIMSQPTTQATIGLRRIIHEAFPKMAKKYGVSPDSKEGSGVEKPGLKFNLYFDHNLSSVSTFEGNDVSLSIVQFSLYLVQENHLALIETLGEEIGHIFREKLMTKVDYDSLDEKRKKRYYDRYADYLVDRLEHQRGRFMHYRMVHEFFGWIGRYVFRDAFNPSIKLSYELFDEKAKETERKRREEMIKEKIGPAIKKAQELGSKVIKTKEEFSKYEDEIYDIINDLKGWGHESDDILERKIYMYFHIESIGGIEEIFDYKYSLDKYMKYLQGKKINEWDKSYKEEFLKAHPDLVALAKAADKETLKAKVFELTAKEIVAVVNKFFKGLPDALREVKVDDYFEYLREIEHQYGYRAAQKHLPEIMKNLPEIVRMTDEEVFDKFFCD